MKSLDTPERPPQGGDETDPEAVRRALAGWYAAVRRDLPWRRTSDPYAIWVSEVMLQQTQVKTVIPYYHRFMERFPDLGRLAAADLQAVYKLWEGLGYYSRARHLHRAAGIVQAEMGGAVPREPDVLRRLPGIGAYIAAAISSIAFGRPFAVVDGNVKRVLARLQAIDAPVNDARRHALFQAAADRLLDPVDPARHNQAMMELGALVCAPRRPLCGRCPLANFCRAFKLNAIDEYPRRLPRRGLSDQQWVAGVVIRNGRLLLTRRPDQGLLAGLWEFPCAPVAAGTDPAVGCREMIRTVVGLACDSPWHLVAVRHTYTHFKLRLEVYGFRRPRGRVRLNGPTAFQWMRPDQLDRLPLHGAVHKALPEIRRRLAESGLRA